LSYPLAEYARWLFFGKSLNQFRRIDLGLPKINFIQSRNHLSSGLPLFYAFSPTLLPRPYDWSEQVKITGHWMLEQEKNWQPPELLVNFLNNGTSPLYVGFGSMVLQNPQQLLDRITGALTETGQRGIFTGDWQGRQNSLSANDQFMWIDRVPHEWLFPQVRAAIHHGGIGTTTNCLKAGIPSIIVPFNYDQPFWGERVKKIGAGPQPIPANQLTQAVLVKAIQDCMDDQEMHQVVRQLQAKINKENGINETIQRIHQDLPLNASIL
jgi:sterol 3beta-glucosyltransferase